MTEHPMVSIIIPVRNAELYLERCLRSISLNRQSCHEVIVVDDGSSDRSAEIAKELGCQVLALTEHQGPYRARNLGAGQARGHILLFFDADQEMRPDFIERLVRSFDQHPEVACVHAAFSWQAPVRSFSSHYKNLTHSFRHESLRSGSCLFSAGLSAVRQEWFSRVGGFPDHPLADVRLGYLLWESGAGFLVDPRLLACHLKEYTLAQLIRSDLLERAMPWASIVLEGCRGRDGTTTWPALGAVLLVTCGYISMLAGSWKGAALLLALAAAVKSRFYGYAFRRRGGAFLAPMVLLDQLMCLLHGIGAFLGVLLALWSRLSGQRTA